MSQNNENDSGKRKIKTLSKEDILKMFGFKNDQIRFFDTETSYRRRERREKEFIENVLILWLKKLKIRWRYENIRKPKNV